MSIDNFLVKEILVRVIKRKISNCHSVKNDSKGPDIRLDRVILLLLEHFWGGIAGRPTRCLDFLLLVKKTP